MIDYSYKQKLNPKKYFKFEIMFMNDIICRKINSFVKTIYWELIKTVQAMYSDIKSNKRSHSTIPCTRAHISHEYEIL